MTNKQANSTILPPSIRINSVKGFWAELKEGEVDFSHSAVILASSHLQDETKFSGISRHLVLYFDDVTASGTRSYNDELAAQIRTFVDVIIETESGEAAGIDTLLVCCDAGQSRSAAIAAAVSRYLGQDEWAIWDNPRYRPNPLVYRLTCKALGIRVWKLALRYRVRRNARALQSAIRSARRK
jgi:predicted protein tyrosine phosphatase